ncbi:copper-resistant cuproprotein CopI [Pseudomonas tohonis]|uniref:copper-resistant cuproprotein CopI n=1 Tax=Pseudomonas tohonis TaxID=2725477 RepID=UPI00255B5DD8|nr:cupredoxin family protein [Pseudomonas tohonis]
MKTTLLALAIGLSTSLPAFADSSAGRYAFGHPAKAAEADRTVEITLGDMYYEPAELDVKAGETVRFVLKNTGALLHEFNLGDAAMHASHQKEMLQMQQMGMLTPTGMNHDMGQMDHSKMGHDMAGMDHGAMMKHDDPNSVLVEPGKTAELTWTFSAATGLEFACNIPGHYQAGMVGRLKVTP